MPSLASDQGQLHDLLGRGIYHAQGGQFYGKTKPERCYATEDEAGRDGCWGSSRNDLLREVSLPFTIERHESGILQWSEVHKHGSLLRVVRE